MTTETMLPFDRESVSALSASRNEPEWLAVLRLKALDMAGALPLPKLEKTKIERWALDAYGTYTPSETIGDLAQAAEGVKEWLDQEQLRDNVLVQHNSSVVYSRLSEQLAAQGVIFTDLGTAAREHAEKVQPYFMQAVKADENRITALHTAYWNGGLSLYVPRNVEVSVPIQALFYSEDAGAAFSPHVLIVAEENAQVSYVENYISGPDSRPLVKNGVVEVFVKSGAKVQCTSVHHLGEEVIDLTSRRAIVDRDGRIEWIAGELDNGWAASETTSILHGDGSTSDAKVVCVGTKKQNMNITTRAVHYGKASDSQMMTRGVMREQATAIINGITKIEKGATKANGEQAEKVLMLSPKARGDANPILLIDEDDVTAGHAASVGQVNPEQIYYMMSRGVSKEDAERLIIYGFLAPVIGEIPVERLEQLMGHWVERKLGQ